MFTNVSLQLRKSLKDLKDTFTEKVAKKNQKVSTPLSFSASLEFIWNLFVADKNSPGGTQKDSRSWRQSRGLSSPLLFIVLKFTTVSFPEWQWFGSPVNNCTRYLLFTLPLQNLWNRPALLAWSSRIVAHQFFYSSWRNKSKWELFFSHNRSFSFYSQTVYTSSVLLFYKSELTLMGITFLLSSYKQTQRCCQYSGTGNSELLESQTAQSLTYLLMQSSGSGDLEVVVLRDKIASLFQVLKVSTHTYFRRLLFPTR